MHEYFNKHKIDCLKIVPSHWRALSPDDGAPLLPARNAGLWWRGLSPLDQAARIPCRYNEKCRIFNHYGPTETTIGKKAYLQLELGEEQQEGLTVPIGKPFSNTEVFVLSKEGMLCPLGVPGELYIAGSGVARGYRNLPDLTAERFVSNPYGNEGAKMYRSGDQVCYQPDGNILFIGRVDDQVKIRGYRVEPGEIGRILEESEMVSQAVVLAREDKQGNKQLVGYIVPAGIYNQAGMQHYMAGRLPEYMVPAYLIALDSFPLTANGKIDRKALPDPQRQPQEESYVPPRTETEVKLAAIWEQLLGLERAGINDNFFKLGGHSLLAMRVISVIRRELEVEIAIKELFVYPTILGLGRRIDEQKV